MKSVIQSNKSYILSMLLLVSSVISFAETNRACGGANDCSDIGQCFTGVTLQSCYSPFTAPPDTIGAVGPEQFVVNVKNGVFSFNKFTGELDNILKSDTLSFWESNDGEFLTDPRIRYDHFTKRWFLIAVPSGIFRQLGLIYFAVSDTHKTDGVITECTKWRIEKIKSSEIQNGPGSTGNEEGLFVDYPTLGIDQHALYIGGNMATATNVIGASFFVIKKESLFESNPIEAVAFRNLGGLNNQGEFLGAFTIQGVDNVSNIDLGFGLGIAINYNDANPTNKLLLYKIMNPNFAGGNMPSLEGPFDVTVPLYIAERPLAPSKGQLPANDGVATLSDKLMNAMINIAPDVEQSSKNLTLFTVQVSPVNKDGVVDPNNPDGIDRTAIRWYQINNLEADPILDQFGTIFDGKEENPRWYYYPSIMTNMRGDILIGSSTSAANQFIDAVCFRRFMGDPLGKDFDGFANNLMREPLYITQSSTSYNIRPGRQIWGDYSYTSLDPNDDMTMWTIQEFCSDTDNWGLKIAEIKAPDSIPSFPQACG